MVLRVCLLLYRCQEADKQRLFIWSILSNIRVWCIGSCLFSKLPANYCNRSFFRYNVYCIYFVIDFAATLYAVLGIEARIKQLEAVRIELEKKYQLMSKDSKLVEFQEKLKSMNVKDDLAEKFNQMLSKDNFLERRLIKAFPDIKSKKHPEYLEHIHDKIMDFYNKKQSNKKGRD